MGFQMTQQHTAFKMLWHFNTTLCEC